MENLQLLSRDRENLPSCDGGVRPLVFDWTSQRVTVGRPVTPAGRLRLLPLAAWGPNDLGLRWREDDARARAAT